MYVATKNADGTITIDGTEPVRQVALIYNCGPDAQELAQRMTDALNADVPGRLVAATWIYRRFVSIPGWVVGFYDPQGEWHGDSEHTSSELAAQRVHYLNGGDQP